MIILHKYFNVPRVKHSYYKATSKTTHFISSQVLFHPVLLPQLLLYVQQREKILQLQPKHMYTLIAHKQDGILHTMYIVLFNSSSMFLPRTFLIMHVFQRRSPFYFIVTRYPFHENIFPPKVRSTTESATYDDNNNV